MSICLNIVFILKVQKEIFMKSAFFSLAVERKILAEQKTFVSRHGGMIEKEIQLFFSEISVDLS